MHVEAISAAVDLRDAQVDEVHKNRRQVALHDVSVDAAKCFDARGGNLGVVETLAHDVTP